MDGTATTYRLGSGALVPDASLTHGAGAPPPPHQPQPAHTASTSSYRSEFIAPLSAPATGTTAASGMPQGATSSIAHHSNMQQQQQQQQLYSNYSAAAGLQQNGNPLPHAHSPRALLSPSIEEERRAEEDDDEAAVPAPFTQQDEKAELATLTIQEIYDAEADVRGMSAAFVNMSLSSQASEAAVTGSGAAAASSSSSSSISASPSGPAVSFGSSPLPVVPPERPPATSVLLPPDATPSGTAAGTMATGSAAPVPTAEELSALYLLDVELLSIPLHQKVSYCTALLKCPDQVSQHIKLAYLRRERFDAEMAAKRIVRYWEVRLSVFGSDRCYLPMTLDGAMRDDADVMIKHYTLLPWSVTVLPLKDTAGRAVVYVKGNALDRKHFSWDQQMRAHWYTLDTLASSPEVCKHGYVTIINGNNVNERRHFSARFFRLIQQLLWEILPTKVKCHHLCHPSKVNYYLIQPLVRAVVGKELRLRQRVHYGTTQKVLNELALYSLPAEILPQDMGGSLELDFVQRFRERAQIEGSSYFDDLPPEAGRDFPMPTQQGLPLPTVMPPSNENMNDVPGAAAGIAASVASKGAADTAMCAPERTKKKRKDKKQKTNNRKGRSGRKSDPRMLRAVEIRLAEPDIPLQEALTRGGFQFRRREDFLGGGTDKDLIDNDGIALSQRKNNLCRRLRVEKEKRKEEEAGVEDDKDYNDDSDSGDDLQECTECEASGVNGTSDDMSGMSGFSSGLSSTVSGDEEIEKDEIVPVVSSTAVTAISGDTRIPDGSHVASKSTIVSSTSSKRHERKDSFDEAIMEIPGLGDVDVDFGGLMEEADKL